MENKSIQNAKDLLVSTLSNLGCWGTDESELLNCVRELSPELLLKLAVSAKGYFSDNLTVLKNCNKVIDMLGGVVFE